MVVRSSFYALMKKLVFLFLAVMMLTACGQYKENNQGAVYVNITAEEAKQRTLHMIKESEEYKHYPKWVQQFYELRLKENL